MKHTLVSMLRGVNVGGHGSLKMAALAKVYAGLGFHNIRTHLQSGNVIFETGRSDIDGQAGAIERALLAACGLSVAVALRSAAAMEATVASNPFLRRAGVDPKFLHATFLIRPTACVPLDRASLPLARGEDLIQVGDVVYVYCPGGYGNTRINNAFIERRLLVRATTRSWRTVVSLALMGRGGAPAP